MSRTWRTADVLGVRPETESATTIRLRFPAPVEVTPGQHIDIRLTAPDGYTAVRSFSLAALLPPDEVELTVEELVDGEVSPYLVRELAAGEQLEVRGPVGGWFVWDPADPSPVQLIGGGSGVVPLMAMARTRHEGGISTPFHLLYSARSEKSVFYRKELDMLAASASPLVVKIIYTRSAPDGQPAGRLTSESLLANVLPAADNPAVFICGATGFVESASSWLVEAGYPPERIKTERYGGIGGDG